MPSTENFDPQRIETPGEERFGLRVRLRPDAPMASVLGADWQSTRWFANANERDQAYSRLKEQHIYSRIGDITTLIVDRISATREDTTS